MDRERYRERDRGTDHRRSRDRDRDRDTDRGRRDQDRGRGRERGGDAKSDGRDREDGNRDRRDRDNKRDRSPPKSEPTRKKLSEMIPGYDDMTPTERVKAKMNLQLNRLSQKETTPSSQQGGEEGTSTTTTKAPLGSRGWERFSFDKHAPLDDHDREDDEQDETAKEIKAARQKMRGAAGALSSVDQSHEDAIFGRLNDAPPPIRRPLSPPSSPEVVPHKRLRTNDPIPERPQDYTDNDSNDQSDLVSAKVAMQQRNRQNEWLRKVEAMRNARHGVPPPSSEEEASQVPNKNK